MLNRIFNNLSWPSSIRNLISKQQQARQIWNIRNSVQMSENRESYFNYGGISQRGRRKALVNRSCFTFTATKLTKEQINQSSYAELVNKITKLYNYQEYKIPSALSLLQIHHQFKIFHPGDWVLDIGAGPNWAWTDLALKLTHKSDGSNRVISNDLLECQTEKDQNTCINGDFMQEQVRTKIAMHLIERQLNTILIDATPEYSALQDQDGDYTLQIFVEALKFSEHYLKKGGTIVFKTLQTPLTLQNQKQARFFFNEVYKYKSNNFRPDSPAFFYVLKGYMMTDNLEGLKNFFKQYQRAKGKGEKIQIVEKYKTKYQWDPAEYVIKEAKQKMTRLRGEGRKNKEIAVMFEDDPYVKANKILALMDQLDDKKANPVSQMKARRQLILGDKNVELKLPQTKEEFAEIFFQKIEEVEKQVKQAKQAKKRKKESKQKPEDIKKVEDRAPLGENQLYMKSTKTKSEGKDSHHSFKDQYFKQDLYGYNPEDPTQPINRNKSENQKEKRHQQEEQLAKLIKSFPEIKQAMQRNKSTFEEETIKAAQKLGQTLFSDFQRPNQKGQTDQELDKEQEVKKFKRSQFQTGKDEQQDEQFLETKSYRLNKKKFSNLDRMKKLDDEFEFDDAEVGQKIKESERQQKSTMEEEEFDQQTKVEYLKSKPRKADRKLRRKVSKQEGSYFKMKKKDQDLD